jgi:hypothetical protein
MAKWLVTPDIPTRHRANGAATKPTICASRLLKNL